MKGPTAVCVYPAGDPVVVDDPVEGCTMNSHKLLKCSWTFNAIEVWNSSCHSVDYEQSQVHVLVTRSAIVFHQAKQLARAPLEAAQMGTAKLHHLVSSMTAIWCLCFLLMLFGFPNADSKTSSSPLQHDSNVVSVFLVDDI